MLQSSPVCYYMLSETVVDEDVAMRRRKVVNENYHNAYGINLFTITYEQVLQDFGVRNWNGRNYDENTVMKAITSNPLIQHDLQMGTWTGEYGHPQIEKEQNELRRQMTIDPKLACNTIDKYWVEGNLLIGKCTTLAGTGGQGEILRDRILTNYPAMASSRAIGGVDSNGNVLPGYTLITFDSVIRPSHKVAYQRGDVDINTFNNAMHSELKGNTMAESAIRFDPQASLKDFLLTESCSRNQIHMLCDTLQLDYDSMELKENSISFKRISENAVDTLIIPINRLVNVEYYNLFD